MTNHPGLFFLEQEYGVKKRSVLDIAEQLNVHENTVYYWLRKTNIEMRRKESLKPDDNVLYSEYILDEMEPEKIAAKYGVSKDTVYRWLREEGLSRRKLVSEEEAFVILNDFESRDVTKTQLAKEYGLSRETIRQRIELGRRLLQKEESK